MPRRSDIHRILVIGSGPIVIGQGAEFDYSGTQAAKALKEEGYEVILVNSNPATIMTDPEVADRTYIEPVTPEFVELIIEREKPDALLPTMGGQTALNVAMALAQSGALARHGVELIGAKERAIAIAEDRKLFGEAMRRIGLAVAQGGIATTLGRGARRSSRTPGFRRSSARRTRSAAPGGGIAYNREEFEDIVRRGLDESPTTQVLIERSVIGWKEFELEVMRDHADNVVIVCSIENLDPMGVHTGDSITVAPAMTLTDREYQEMRDAAVAIIREVGVEAGGCNIQFAVNPRDGEMLVIEMNPRVSRSSALASKATGFPIARIGAKLAVGYRLEEIPNDITKTTPASVRAGARLRGGEDPAFRVREVPGRQSVSHHADEVGGRGDGYRPHVQGGAAEGAPRAGDGARRAGPWRRGRWTTGCPTRAARRCAGALRQPTPERIFQIKRAFLSGMSVADVADLTAIDPWFLQQMHELVDAERWYRGARRRWAAFEMRRMKRMGFSDRQLGALARRAGGRGPRATVGARRAPVVQDGRHLRRRVPLGHAVSVQRATTRRPRRPQSGRPSVVILGSGPNRIGQGVEFDYCCVRAAMALREQGYETIMINSNPETVSTDFDTSRQALLRAADPGGRAGDRAARAAGRA